MLAALLNIPRTNEEWQRYSFDHRDSHDRIRAAISQKHGVSLTDYQIDPINPESVQQFLQNNASLHTDMNGVLKTQSSDLEDADLSNERELQAWVRLHYQEHLNAELVLEI